MVAFRLPKATDETTEAKYRRRFEEGMTYMI